MRIQMYLGDLVELALHYSDSVNDCFTSTLMYINYHLGDAANERWSTRHVS